MNKLYILLSVVSVVLVMLGCADDLVEHGSGMCYSALPLNHMYKYARHTYMVQDSARKEYDIPVVDDPGKHLELFLSIRRQYAREDSATAWYRPVRIAYEKRQKLISENKKGEPSYFLTGMEAVPRQ